MSRHFGGTTGRRSYIAGFALLAVVVVLAYAAYRPSSRREAVRWVRFEMAPMHSNASAPSLVHLRLCTPCQATGSPALVLKQIELAKWDAVLAMLCMSFKHSG